MAKAKPCNEHGLPEPVFSLRRCKKVLKSSYYKEMPRENKDGGVNELLEFIEKNPNQRTKQISESLNIPLRTTEKWLKQLKDAEKIEFVGSSKTGGYFVKY